MTNDDSARLGCGVSEKIVDKGGIRCVRQARLAAYDARAGALGDEFQQPIDSAVFVIGCEDFVPLLERQRADGAAQPGCGVADKDDFVSGYLESFGDAGTGARPSIPLAAAGESRLAGARARAARLGIARRPPSDKRQMRHD